MVRVNWGHGWEIKAEGETEIPGGESLGIEFI